MTRKAVLIMLLLLLLGTVGAMAQVREGTLVIGTTTQIESINPFTSVYQVYFGTMRWVYDMLYQKDGYGEPIPNLAESVEVSEDGLVYTFKIREDAVFQDNTPLTAYDGAFSFNYIMENELGFYTAYVAPVESVEALDKYTLQIVLNQAVTRSWLNKNTFMWIPFFPEHIWKNRTAEEAVGEVPIDELIGSGPLQWVEFKANELIRMKAHNWTHAQPQVEQIIMRMFASSSSMIEALKAGEIDLAFSIPEAVVNSLLSMQQVSVKSSPSYWLEDIIYNSYGPAYEECRDSHPHPALQDTRVRRAMSWALDKELLVNLIHVGFATPGNQWLPPAYGELSNTSLEPIGYDIDKACEILDEAGYKDSDGDGIREMESGLPLEFDLWTPNSDQVNTGEIWANSLKDVGIKLNVSLMDGGTLWSHMPMSWDFDIAIWSWVGEADINFLLSVLTCEQVSSSGWSDCGYCNPEYDELFGAQRTAKTFEERKEIVWKMQEIVYNEMPYDVLFNVQWLDAWRNDQIKGNFDYGDASYSLLNKYFILSVKKIQ